MQHLSMLRQTYDVHMTMCRLFLTFYMEYINNPSFVFMEGFFRVSAQLR